MTFLHITVSGASQSISLGLADLVELLMPSAPREEVKGGPLFVSFDPSIDPATVPRRPPIMRSDDLICGFGGDRIEDEYWFRENHGQRFRVLSATRGDRFRAGFPDVLPDGHRAIRISRLRERNGDPFNSSARTFVMPSVFCARLNAASDTELSLWWYLLSAIKALSPNPDDEEVHFA
jgi:hypothetical protein